MIVGVDPEPKKGPTTRLLKHLLPVPPVFQYPLWIGEQMAGFTILDAILNNEIK